MTITTSTEPSRLRILQVILSRGFAGSERAAAEACNALVQTHDVAIVVRRDHRNAAGASIRDYLAHKPKGKFGKPTEIPFKVRSLTPDGKKVISLVWHNRADLDLQVQSPDGKLTSAKFPNTAVVPDDHKIPNGGLPGNGVLSRDSNARCQFDGIMQEDVVFTGDPMPGDYLVWVDLYDSCGEPATTFDLQLHEDGVQTFNIVGQQLDINWSFSFTPWLAVLLLFVLAQVFDRGARMRADLEGTV